jgi:hypothetical protein
MLVSGMACANIRLQVICSIDQARSCRRDQTEAMNNLLSSEKSTCHRPPSSHVSMSLATSPTTLVNMNCSVVSDYSGPLLAPAQRAGSRWRSVRRTEVASSPPSSSAAALAPDMSPPSSRKARPVKGTACPPLLVAGYCPCCVSPAGGALGPKSRKSK